jgi:transcriptional regulator with XRE-family HTH domain
MKLGEKLSRLRSLEGFARGLGREMTQSEVSQGIRDSLDGQISQSYLSQIENGTRPHLTANTRALLAKFFRVHPGYLVDDPEDAHLPIRPRRALDDRVDHWLIESAEEFRDDIDLHRALLAIAKHDQSRQCLLLLGSIVENRVLIDRLVERLTPAQPRPKRVRSSR